MTTLAEAETLTRAGPETDNWLETYSRRLNAARPDRQISLA